jgi:hypothetical protein
VVVLHGAGNGGEGGAFVVGCVELISGEIDTPKNNVFDIASAWNREREIYLYLSIIL